MTITTTINPTHTNTDPTITQEAMTNQEPTVAEVSCEEAMTTREGYKVRFERMSYDDYRNMGVIIPMFQRGFVWDDKKRIKWGDTVTNSIPAPAIILAEIGEGEDAEYLLIDGVQRTTAHRLNLEDITNTIDTAGETLSDEHMDRLCALQDAYEGYIFQVMVVSTGTVEQAADLFIRYNSGATLNGVQRDKASLDAGKLDVIGEWEKFTKSIAPKYARVSPDTVALMLCAAVTMPHKMSSSSATASKVLAEVDKENLAKLDLKTASIVQKAFKALTVVNVPETGYTAASWLTPARFIPLYMAIKWLVDTAEQEGKEIDNDGIAQDIAVRLANMSTTSKVKYVPQLAYTSRAKSTKGKILYKTAPATTISTAFGDRSNAYKATQTRTDVICGVLGKGNVSKASTPAPSKSPASNQTDDVVSFLDSLLSEG